MVVQYFETATWLWWLLIIAMCVLASWAVHAKSINGATFVILVCLGILVVFGDTGAYLSTLLKPMQIVYGFGIYLIGSAVWGITCWAYSGWKADTKSIIAKAVYWPFAGLGSLGALLWSWATNIIG